MYEFKLRNSKLMARVAIVILTLIAAVYPGTYCVLRLNKHLVRRAHFEGYGPSGPLLQYFDESEIGHGGLYAVRTESKIAKHDENMKRLFGPLMKVELWLRGFDELGSNSHYDGS